MSESDQPKTWVITYCSVCEMEMMAGSWEQPPVCMNCAGKPHEATGD